MDLLQNYKKYLLDLGIKNINSRLSVAKNFIKYLNNRTITEKIINNFCTNSTRKSIIKYLLIANNIYLQNNDITESKYADITKFLQNNNFSENTIKTYKYRLEKFLDYIGTEDITESKIKEFLKYKKNNEQKNYAALLKMYFRYLNYDFNIEINNISTKNKKTGITESEIYKLIQYINKLDSRNYLDLNLKTCLIFALFSDLKITEFQKLNLGDIKIKENNIIKIKYNNKEKIILNTNLIFINHITELNNIFENKNLPLIRTISKRKMTSNTIHKKISKVLKELNIINKM